jgi:hypothetical protein
MCNKVAQRDDCTTVDGRAILFTVTADCGLHMTGSYVLCCEGSCRNTTRVGGSEKHMYSHQLIVAKYFRGLFRYPSAWTAVFQFFVPALKF